MSNVALSVPGIVVNNIPVEIVPNSLNITNGWGEIKVRNGHIGSGTNTSIHTEDAESKVSEISFKVFITEANKVLYKSFKDNIGGNVIVISEKLAGLPSVGTHMSLTNDPKWEHTADGTAEVVFKGDVIQ